MPAMSATDVLAGPPIPVISNRLLMGLIEVEKIQVTSFDARNLAPTAYQLRPYRIRLNSDSDEGFPLADRVLRLSDEKGRNLRPGEYAVVSPRETIILSEGFVADFFPSSWCIENNLLLTAGRLDAGYKSDIVLGVFNGGRRDVELSTKFQLARVTFGWLGQNNMPVYGGTPPGAYIPQLTRLRALEADLSASAAALQKQRLEVERAKRELEEKASASQ